MFLINLIYLAAAVTQLNFGVEAKLIIYSKMWFIAIKQFNFVQLIFSFIHSFILYLSVK